LVIVNKEKWQKYLDIVKQEKIENHEPNYDIIKLFSRYMPPESHAKILEVAAGAGVDMTVLRKEGYNVEGIDINPENIRYAQENFGISIHHQDMHDLKFPPLSFDGILSIQTFEHSLSPFIVASEMYRVLRHRGRVFLDTCDPDDDAMWGIWHPSLLHPRQIIKLFNMLKFNLVEDLSRKHRTQIVFEKGGD